MRFINIENEVTKIVAGYIAQGYTLHTQSLEHEQVDLQKGYEIVRVAIAKKHDWETGVECVYIRVGVCDSSKYFQGATLWDDMFDMKKVKEFFAVKSYGRYEEGWFVESADEALKCVAKHRQRLTNKNINKGKQLCFDGVQDIGKKVIQKHFKLKRVNAKDIKVFAKWYGKERCYLIEYKNKDVVLGGKR